MRRRRKPRAWSDDEEARIVAATLQPGANVAAVARSEGLDPSQLYGWRRKGTVNLSVGFHAELSRFIQPSPFIFGAVFPHYLLVGLCL
ncbi:MULTISPECIES: transposase [Agrobacterium]|uniref:transposase n=1 Tax=Agrobacterium TaxID=357 RepID=UPI001FDA5DAB|nr:MULTISPECIES: transposase [Agrobacterium]